MKIYFIIIRRVAVLKLTGFFIFFFCILCTTGYAERLLFVTLDNDPQAYMENGRTAGFLAEIVTEAARRAGYVAEIKIVPWKRALTSTRKGYADAVFNAGFNEERAAYLRYPDTVLITEKIVAFRKTGSDVFLSKNFKEAGELVVGVGRGFYYGRAVDKAVRNNLFKRVEEVPNIDLNIKKLLLNRIDIFFGDYYPVINYINENGLLTKVETILDPLSGIPMVYSESDTYLAFSKKKSSVPFVQVNEQLRKMKQDGTCKSLMMKYIPVHEGF